MNDWITEQLALCDAATPVWRIANFDNLTLHWLHSKAGEADGKFLQAAADNYPAALRMLWVAVKALDAPLKHLYHSQVCAFDKAHGEGPPVPLDTANCLRCHLAKALEEIKEIGGAQ